MNQLIMHSIAVGIALSSCIGSSESSGSDAREEFESRTELKLPAAVTDWGYSSVQIGDTYGEYYRFKCSNEVFHDTAKKLDLKPDPLPSYAGATHWGRAVGERNPNDPSWWKLAAANTEIFHKEDYSTVAHRSVMAFWYHGESGTAYMSIDFWD